MNGSIPGNGDGTTVHLLHSRRVVASPIAALLAWRSLIRGGVAAQRKIPALRVGQLQGTSEWQRRQDLRSASPPNADMIRAGRPGGPGIARKAGALTLIRGVHVTG